MPYIAVLVNGRVVVAEREVAWSQNMVFDGCRLVLRGLSDFTVAKLHVVRIPASDAWEVLLQDLKVVFLFGRRKDAISGYHRVAILFI